MTPTADTASFTDFSTHLRDHLNERKSTHRPLFITNDGETEAVVLSPSAFDELIDQAEMGRSLSMLDRSIEDIKAGRTRPAKAAMHDIADELKLKLER